MNSTITEKPPLELSARQREIALMLADGYTSPEVAELIGLSDHTVRTHIKNAMSRNELRTRTQLAVLADREQRPVNAE